jgi:hypothetical protein
MQSFLWLRYFVLGVKIGSFVRIDIHGQGLSSKDKLMYNIPGDSYK